MDRRILLTAIGFRPAMVLPLIDLIEPDEVVAVSTHHGKAVETEAAVRQGVQQREIPYEAVEVDDWDMLAWSDAIEAYLDRYRDDQVTVNVTAGHGLAVAMLSVHAAQRGLPIVCYDWEDEALGRTVLERREKLHPHSPAAVLNLRSLSRADRKVLLALLEGEQTVNELATNTEQVQSTVSTSLQRLSSKGFLERERHGRNVHYRVRSGVRPMVAKALLGRTI